MKRKPAKPEDLDMEMDTYWFQAGKGPDPNAAKLDREMEQYWQSKPAPETKTAAVEAN